MLKDLVAAEQTARKTEGGYWIASLDPDAASTSLTGSVHIGRTDGPRRAALLSDAVSRSVTHLDVHSIWADLLESLFDQGPLACIEPFDWSNMPTPLADGSHEQQQVTTPGP